MADYINNVSAQDEYAAALTLGPTFTAKSAIITVANNPALMQFAIGRIGDWRWTDEREFFSIPQSFRVGNIVGIRFRNAVAGDPAQILCTLYGDADPVFEAGTPFTATLSATGSISSNVIVPTVALASFPPANPSDGQTVLLALPSSYDPIGGKTTRWLCSYDASLAMWHVTGAPLAMHNSGPLTPDATDAWAYPDAIPAPRPGDYLGRYLATGWTTTNNSGIIGLVLGVVKSAGTILNPQEIVGGVGAPLGNSGDYAALVAEDLLTGLAAGDQILGGYNFQGANPGNARLISRVLTATPVRIS